MPVIAGSVVNNPGTPQPSWSDARNRTIEDTMEPPTTHLVTKPSELPPAIQPATLPKQIMQHYPSLAQIKLNMITAKCDQAVLTTI